MQGDVLRGDVEAEGRATPVVCERQVPDRQEPFPDQAWVYQSSIVLVPVPSSCRMGRNAAISTSMSSPMTQQDARGTPPFQRR